MTVEVFAPAKINLTLHVTGQRDDGFHFLDSLVVFVDVGDNVSASLAPSLSLTLKGPFAGALPQGAGNLVLDAAALFPDSPGANITLEKNLPVASGIGGGSADAAAAIKALSQLWHAPIPNPDDVLRLGADVPVCLLGKSVRMRGIGENLTPFGIPDLHILLVNPMAAVSTSAVFSNLENRNNPPMLNMPELCAPIADFTHWLAEQRNDLQEPACLGTPQIGQTLAEIGGQEGCLLARMSGSGATCFGIFATAAATQAAAYAIIRSHRDWWIKPARTLR